MPTEIEEGLRRLSAEAQIRADQGQVLDLTVILRIRTGGKEISVRFEDYRGWSETDDHSLHDAVDLSLGEQELLALVRGEVTPQELFLRGALVIHGEPQAVRKAIEYLWGGTFTSASDGIGKLPVTVFQFPQ